MIYANRPGSYTLKLNAQGFVAVGDEPVAKTVTIGPGDRGYWKANDTLNVMYPHTTKWGGYDPTDDFGYALVKDFPIMRFAEAYLLRAEARFRHINNQDAADDYKLLQHSEIHNKIKKIK